MVGGKTLSPSRKMKELMMWYNHGDTCLHPVECRAMLHAIFVGIYSFMDANSRTSRFFQIWSRRNMDFHEFLLKFENVTVR